MTYLNILHPIPGSSHDQVVKLRVHMTGKGRGLKPHSEEIFFHEPLDHSMPWHNLKFNSILKPIQT